MKHTHHLPAVARQRPLVPAWALADRAPMVAGGHAHVLQGKAASAARVRITVLPPRLVAIVLAAALAVAMAYVIAARFQTVMAAAAVTRLKITAAIVVVVAQGS